MDITTILGLLAGIIIVGWGIITGGTQGPLENILAFWDPASIYIVVGGTFAAVLVNYPLKQVLGLFSIMKNAFTSKELDPTEVISTLVGFAERARREGLLALEELANQLDEPFLRQGLSLVVDGTDPELVRSILETDLAFVEERHKSGAGMLDSMAALAPAFGMIGTLIGLVQMLKNLDDPSSIGPGMAVALLTTFYGSMLANLIFIPMAGKLRVKSSQEVLMKEVMIEGILSIQAGDSPRIVEEKLKAFLAPKHRTARRGLSEED